MRALEILTVVAMAMALVMVAPGCGPNAEERCAELKQAPCPEGGENFEEGPEYCVPRYDGECSGEWDDYVSCAIEQPQCSTTTTPCFDVEFMAFADCLCEYESQFGPTPWCF